MDRESVGAGGSFARTPAVNALGWIVAMCASYIGLGIPPTAFAGRQLHSSVGCIALTDGYV